MLFSKCLRAKIYCNMNGHFDPQGCQTLLLKESELFFLSLGSWTINAETKKPPPIVTRKAGDAICPTANVRYLYQPGELEDGKKRATDPIWSVDIHKIDYNIVTQGIRVYYLNAPAPKRGFVKEELLIVPADTNTRMHMS